MVCECGTNRAHDRPEASPDHARRSIGERLNELALSYVGRFATTRAKLAAYLNRKLRERGWEGDGEPRSRRWSSGWRRLGYVDDAAYALSKARSLGQRGYGARRVRRRCARPGSARTMAAAAKQASREQAVDAALRFAQRRRLGPFAAVRADPRERENALGGDDPRRPRLRPCAARSSTLPRTTTPTLTD